MKLATRFKNSRYGWYYQGLPDISRASAMFTIKRNTMTTAIRCKTLWDSCSTIIRHGVPGDFVECGVWRGGSAGIMALTLLKLDPKGSRNLHLFDSFEGLPEPTEEDGQQAADYSGGVNSGALKSVHQCEAGIDIVKELLLGTLAFPNQRIHFHKGWFQETIPVLGEEPKQIAVLRLDGDWYDSTKVCLEHLYDRVPKGGLIILDDYFAWEGCKKATDEFRASRGITDELIRVDIDCAYWTKGKI